MFPQALKDVSGNSAALNDRRAGSWIKVEDHLIRRRRRLLSGHGTPQWNVDFESGEVRCPDKRRSIGYNHKFDRAFFGTRRGNRRRSNPARCVRRRVLLVERLTIDAVWEATEGCCPIAQVWKHHVRDACVIVENVALCESRFWIQDLVEVREGKPSAIDFRFDAAFRAHGQLRSDLCPVGDLAKTVASDGRLSSIPKIAPRRRAWGGRIERARFPEGSTL